MTQNDHKETQTNKKREMQNHHSLFGLLLSRRGGGALCICVPRGPLSHNTPMSPSVLRKGVLSLKNSTFQLIKIKVLVCVFKKLRSCFKEMSGKTVNTWSFKHLATVKESMKKKNSVSQEFFSINQSPLHSVTYILCLHT